MNQTGKIAKIGLLIGIFWSMLSCSAVMAEYFLHTYIPEIDLSHYPRVQFKMIVNDFENTASIAGKDKCRSFSSNDCYHIELYENDFEISGVEYRHDHELDKNTEVLEVRYTSKFPKDSERKLKIQIDINGLHNYKGDIFLFKTVITTTYKLAVASNEELAEYWEWEQGGEEQNLESPDSHINEGIARTDKITESGDPGPQNASVLDSKLSSSIDFKVVNTLTNPSKIDWKKDEYWDRAVVIATKNSAEELSQVRVDIGGSVPRLVFLRKFQRGENEFAQIVEYDTEFYIIEEFQLGKNDIDGKWVTGDPGIFRRKHFDNLWIHEGLLYYYTSYELKNDLLKAYTLGSRQPGKNGSFELWKTENPRLTFDTLHLAHQSPDRSMTAAVNYDAMSIYFGDSVYSELKRSEQKKAVEFNFPKVNYTTKLALKDISKLEKFCEFMVGAVSWSDDSKSLFFDNSGICAACIYEIDIQSLNVIKIIPEHEAIEPYFFKWQGMDCIAYVEKNQVKIARRK